MTSEDLRSYFFSSLATQAQFGTGPGRLTKKDHPAMLFTADEVTLDKANAQVLFPSIGPVTVPELSISEKIPKFEWAALVRDRKPDEWSLVLGCGNPYLTENANGLPVINGAVIAVPWCLHRDPRTFLPLCQEEDHEFCGNKEEEILIPIELGRNDPCLCGSGKKYKKCCLLTG